MKAPPIIAPEIKKHLKDNEKVIKGFVEMFGIHKDIHGRPINAETEVAGHFAGDYMLKVWPNGSCQRCYPGHPDFPKNEIN